MSFRGRGGRGGGPSQSFDGHSQPKGPHQSGRPARGPHTAGGHPASGPAIEIRLATGPPASGPPPPPGLGAPSGVKPPQNNPWTRPTAPRGQPADKPSPELYGKPSPMVDRPISLASAPSPTLNASSSPPEEALSVNVGLSTTVSPPKGDVIVYIEGPPSLYGVESVALFAVNMHRHAKPFAIKRCLPRGGRPGQPPSRQVKFFAPTGVGLYEFRVFDGEYVAPEDDEPEPVVIGRSKLLRVDVQGDEIVNDVDLVLKKLSEVSTKPGNPSKRDLSRLCDGLVQLRTLFHFLVKPPSATKAPIIAEKLNTIVEHALRHCAEVQAAFVFSKTPKVPEPPVEPGAEDGSSEALAEAAPAKPVTTKDPAELGWIGRERAAIHAGVKSLLDELFENPISRSMVGTRELYLRSQLYCSLTDTLLPIPEGIDASTELPPRGSCALPATVCRYTVEAVNSYMNGSLDEDMAMFAGEGGGGELSVDDFVCPDDLPPEVVEPLSMAIGAIASHYVPSPAMDEKRSIVLHKLSSAMSEHLGPLIPSGVGVTWHVFGSSANTFGMESSDVDVCALWRDGAGQLIPQQLPPAELVRVASLVAEELGMEEISVRDTARIPIVLFKDPETNLHVDVCGISNLLALRNTALLRAYSACDSRLRPLAFFLKNWASVRDINNPSKSTLSSYGYLLMIISMLQRQPHMALPCLQAMSPSWNGSGLSLIGMPDLPPFPVQFNGKAFDTYFYQPDHPAAVDAIRRCCASNTDSVGRLLLKFFWHFCFGFDTRRKVISVRPVSQLDVEACHRFGLPFPDAPFKDEKVSSGFWTQRAHISIEDPFETTYDVAHVLRPLTTRTMKMEMARAYGLLVKVARSCEGDPGKIMGMILGQLLEKVDHETDAPVVPSDELPTTA